MDKRIFSFSHSNLITILCIIMLVDYYTLSYALNRKWDVLSGVAEMVWDVLSGVAEMVWDVLSRAAKMAWDVMSG